MGRTGGGCTISHRQGRSTGNQSVQNADGTTVWMDASVTCHRFNSWKYDVNVIKQFLIPYFLTTATTEEHEEDEEEEEREQEVNKKDENDGVGSMFVIKRNNTFMCLSTDQLKFLDMINYIAPGSATPSI